MSSGNFDSLTITGEVQLSSLSIGLSGTPSGVSAPIATKEKKVLISANSIQAKETKWDQDDAANAPTEWKSQGMIQSPLSIQPEGGDVAFGTTTQPCQLDIFGDMKVNGNIEVTGDIYLQNADIAELFAISEIEAAEPGTVMVLDEAGGLRASTTAYDKRVVGIVSGAGDYRPGILLDKHVGHTHCQPIALNGKVYCKVDAQMEPIEVGDLLTTSPTTGYAMKAIDHYKSFGAVIGKAMRALPGGKDLIPILVALQ